MTGELTFAAAFVAGLLGSGHCLGMCGGIAVSLGMAMPAEDSRFRHVLLASLYGIGRVSSYALAGALLAGLGGALAGWIDIPRWSVGLRIATGVIIALLGIQYLLGRPLFGLLEKAGARVWQKLAPLARRLLPVRTPAQAFGLGLLWGWLPCGLVYTMLTAALLSGTALGGASIMAAFGLGTMPAMLGSSVAARRMLRWTHDPWLRRAAGVAVLGMGIWIVAMPLMHSGHAEHSSQHTHTVGSDHAN